MGTEIQANAYFPKNHHMIDLNGNGRNGLMSLRHDNQMTRNGQGGDPTMTQAYQNGYPVNNLEKVRQTILTHESVFRNQLQELHRLYRRQRDLMNEFNMGEIKNSPNLMLASPGDVSASSFSSPHIEPRDFFKNSLDRTDRGLAFGNPELRNGRTWNELPFDGQTERRIGVRCDTRDYCPAKSQMCPESLLPVSRNGPLTSPLESGESLYQKKRKIFGVEIQEGNTASCDATVRSTDSRKAEQPFWMKESVPFKQNVTPRLENRHMVSTVPPPWSSNSFLQNLELLGKNVNGGCASIRPNSYGGPNQHGAGIDPETPKGGLPWFLRNTQSNGEPSKGGKSSYFMNLDSLQNCSQTFFMRAEVGDGSIPGSKQKKEISVPVNALNVEGGMMTEINKSQSATKILGFSISDMLHSSKDSDNSSKRIDSGGSGEVRKDENGPRCQLETKNLDHVSTLRHHIDLNLALDEEDAPLTPCLPTAVVKIATTEIDLEAPVIESEADATHNEAKSSKSVSEVSRRESEISYKECDKSAADALINISCFGVKSLMDKAHELPQAESTDCLKWFADIIASQSENLVDQNRVIDEEDPMLEGMDLFEFMTLKLEDTKNQNYLYNPMILDIPDDEETTPVAPVHKPSRRGQSRRGRQQKDFQRDILPAIATLSRHEMKEDIKAFEEIYKGEGSARNLSKSNSMKKGKGRKRTVGPSTPPQAKPHCSTRTHQEPVNQELRLVEGSLVGWGKKTRRMPRQRCQNLHLSHSLPVKC